MAESTKDPESGAGLLPAPSVPWAWHFRTKDLQAEKKKRAWAGLSSMELLPLTGSVSLIQIPNLSEFQHPLKQEMDDVAFLAGIVVRIWNQVYTVVAASGGRGSTGISRSINVLLEPMLHTQQEYGKHQLPSRGEPPLLPLGSQRVNHGFKILTRQKGSKDCWSSPRNPTLATPKTGKGWPTDLWN